MNRAIIFRLLQGLSRAVHQAVPVKWMLALYLCGAQLDGLTRTYEERAIAAVLMGEAWSEGMTGMTAVAEVIRQRAVEKGWSPLRVVAARRGGIHAFSCLNGTTLDGLINKFSIEPDFQKALQLAQVVCRSPDRLPGTARGANHFSHAKERPYWTKAEKPVVVIGRHAFYRLKPY